MSTLLWVIGVAFVSAVCIVPVMKDRILAENESALPLYLGWMLAYLMVSGALYLLHLFG